MIISAKRVGSLSSLTVKPLAREGLSGGPAGKSFKEVLHSIEGKKPQSKVPNDPFQAMNHLTNRVLQGEKISSTDLLLYQVKAGQFGMNVELISKVAESGSASLRKLQNQG